MKKYFYIIAFVVLALCACNKVETLEKEHNETAAVYHLSLQAGFAPQTKGVSFSDESTIDTFFEGTDCIYVYNETKQALARHWDYDENTYIATAINPTAITGDGKSCSLAGDLSFVKWDSGWEEVSPEAGDVYSLYYLMSEADYSFKGASYYPRFNYSEQTGSVSSASQFDFAEATGVVLDLDGTTLSVPAGVAFSNLQSMFRQKLTFKDSEDNTVTPTIKQLTVTTANETLVTIYNPTRDSKYETYSLDIDDPVLSDDGNIYLSLMFYYPDADSRADQFILTATDADGNVYIGVKDVPDGGFQLGKYYYGDMTLAWDHKTIKPLLIQDGNPLGLGDPGKYGIDPGLNDVITLSIAGPSLGYVFYLNDEPATVTLTGEGGSVSASYAENDAFINSDDDLTIILDCNYVINCPNCDTAIWSYGNLKLKTTGGTQTLSVIVGDDGTSYYGIYGDSNYDAIYYHDVNNLAADGFTVSREGPTDNSDGTYTWVYTVTPD